MYNSGAVLVCCNTPAGLPETKGNMMKNLVMAVVLMAVNSAWAYDSCDLQLNKGLRITSDTVAISEGDKVLYKIVKDQHLWVKGQELRLDANQQAALIQYSKSLRQMVPEARAFALDAVDISTAVVLAMFDNVADPDSATRKKLLGEFTSLKADIAKKYADGAPVYFNEKNTEDIFGDEFNPHVEAIVQSAGEEFAFGLLRKMGGILLSPDSEKEFESRMEKFSERMDKEMHGRAEKLEQHAIAFCATATRLDLQEEQLRNSVKELSQIDLVSVTQGKGEADHDLHSGAMSASPNTKDM